MKARDYAISLGLAKPGSRGRMSSAAIKAIEEAIADGKTFDDYGSNHEPVRNSTIDRDCDTDDYGASDRVDLPPIKSRPAKHDFSQIWGIDTRGRRPLKIAFSWCACCIVQVKYCSAERPKLPGWIGGGPGLINEPTEEEMALAMESANEQS